MNPAATDHASTLARDAIDKLCRAFEEQDVAALLACFARQTPASYAGSEDGEIATGPDELAALFADLLGLPQRYVFEFTDLRAHAHAQSISVLADGRGHELHPNGNHETFNYRISGTLVPEDEQWVWLLLSGSEPTRPQSQP